jgi:hypothetical protein
VLYIDFVAEPSTPGTEPRAQTVNSDASFEDTKRLAESTFRAGTYPWAVRFRIRNENYQEVYSWPET